MELFRELGIKIKGLDNTEGSGCLYNIANESSTKYVLTAQHCLTKDTNKRLFTFEEMKEIEVIDISGEKLPITEIHVPEDTSEDFAVIKIQTFKDYKSVITRSPKRNMKYTFFGYPEFLKNERDKTFILEGDIIENRGKLFELKNEYGPLSDYDNDAKENTVGLSGSGVYNQEGESYSLIGILTSLRAKGNYGRLLAIDIKVIEHFIESKGLEPLSPKELKSFETYLPSLLREEENKFKLILNKKFNDHLLEITPSFIHEKLRGKIFLPYDEFGNILNKNLWEGWLRFLLYISLIEEGKLSLDTVHQHVFIQEPNSSKKRFYFTQETRMATFVRLLYEESTYKDISNNDLIFINSEKFRGKTLLAYKDIHEIIPTIDSPYFYEKNIDITNPNEMKKVSVIHLDYLIDQIEDELRNCIVNNKTTLEIEQMCIKCIKDILRFLEDEMKQEV